MIYDVATNTLHLAVFLLLVLLRVMFTADLECIFEGCALLSSLFAILCGFGFGLGRLWLYLLLSLPFHIASLDGDIYLSEGIVEEWEEMNQGEDHNNDYVCDADTTASFRVAYEVAEQHHAVEDVNSDQRVKGLHVVVKPRLERLYPLNRYDQEGGDHEL